MRWLPLITVALVLTAGCADRGGLGVGGNDDGGVATGGTPGGGHGGGGQGGGGQDAGSDASVCPALGCAADCPYGTLTDGRGCPTCQCKPPPVCKPLLCPAIACPNGVETDAQGCPTCTCHTGCAASACFLYCPYGFQHDANGCQLCACNSGACTPADCNGGAGVPADPVAPVPRPMCPGGVSPITTCVRTPAGTCGWITGCPDACSGVADASACSLNPTCVWLEPGCGQPLPGPACYERALIGCADRGSMCPAGKTCQQRSIRYCVGEPPPNGSTASGPTAHIPAPGGGVTAPVCQSCPQPFSICL